MSSRVFFVALLFIAFMVYVHINKQKIDKFAPYYPSYSSYHGYYPFGVPWPLMSYNERYGFYEYPHFY